MPDLQTANPSGGRGKTATKCQRNCTKQKSKNAYETTRKQIKTKRIPKTITMYTCVCTNAHKMNEHRMITPKNSNNLGHMQNIACLSNASWESGKPTRMRAVTYIYLIHKKIQKRMKEGVKSALDLLGLICSPFLD